MKDTDQMPFGKYSKHPDKRIMQDVPASYLLWLWNEGLNFETKLTDNRGKVARYIRENMSALQQEDKDTIIKKEFEK